MAIFSFFKKPQHQKFEYKPRYWNPEKEDLDRRIELANRDNNNPAAMKSRIAQGLQRRRYSGSRNNSGASKKSSLRVLIILGILLTLCYYFLVVYLPKI